MPAEADSSRAPYYDSILAEPPGAIRYSPSVPRAIAGLLASPAATASHDGTDLLPRLRAKDFVVVHDTCDFTVEPGRTPHVALPQPVGHVAAWHIGTACFIADAGKSGSIDLGIGRRSRPRSTDPDRPAVSGRRFY